MAMLSALLCPVGVWQCQPQLVWDFFLSPGRHRCLRPSTPKRNPHYQTLERDLIELQEQRLFELFVVVSLHKKASEVTYTPHIIQQFPSKVGAAWKPAQGTTQLCVSPPKLHWSGSELGMEHLALFTPNVVSGGC